MATVSRACVCKTSFYSTLFKWQYMLAYECRKELQNGACLFGSARVWEYIQNTTEHRLTASMGVSTKISSLGTPLYTQKNLWDE